MPGCPHPAQGPAIAGSPDVMVNGRPALRVDDVGIHAACCGPNMWRAKDGSATVFINGKPAFRVGDGVRHCGGDGSLVEGSTDVIIGGSSSGSGGDAGSGGGSSGAGGSGGGGRGAESPSGAADGDRAAAATRSAGSSTATPAAATSPAAPVAADLKDWIEIRLVDDQGEPVSGEDYRVELPDGSLRTGRLDADGRARLTGIARGACRVSFPFLDATSWEPST